MTRRLAGAPITWGVCEVPGWGYQMDPDRVLSEMASLGLVATELGPEGYLPVEADDLRAMLDRHGLGLAAGFIPVVLHHAERWQDERERAIEQIRLLAEAGADVAVVAASTGAHGYETSGDLEEHQWRDLAAALTELADRAQQEGLDLTIHPHYGTTVEGPEATRKVLDMTDVGVCLDTGHILVGGGDPVALAREAAERITHVHLKDVDAGLAERVRSGEVTYHDAVTRGLYRPLGEGDVDVATIVETLEDSGFEGWFVFEQDTVLGDEPPERGGPLAAAAASLRFLEAKAPG